MITITQPKVQGFWPRWAPFKGFSLLFDTPGRSTSPLAGEAHLLKLDCQIESAPEQDFYRRLAAGLDKIGLDVLINNYLFCPLERYSYHTTVWDGLNDGNAVSVSAEYRQPLHRYLEQFPHSFADASIFTEAIAHSPLVTEQWKIEFALDHVAKWGNVGLVAVLKPAEESAARYEALKTARERLYEQFEQRFELHMHWPYVPHVSLGYFANQEQAEEASPHMEHWNDIIRGAVNERTITYNTISLYGYTDMITFFKQAGESS